MDEQRLAEIRYWLSTGENATPSCLDCNEHVLLAEVDRLSALVEAQTRLLDRVYALAGDGLSSTTGGSTHLGAIRAEIRMTRALGSMTGAARAEAQGEAGA